jgi:Trm5-related predicted tRNA methylase
MSKKATKVKNEDNQIGAEENLLDRPWWVDASYWNQLTDEEKQKLVQQN